MMAKKGKIMDCIFLLKDGSADDPDCEILGTFTSEEDAFYFLEENIGIEAAQMGIEAGDYGIFEIALPAGYKLVKE
jgi:hypothetical protein